MAMGRHCGGRTGQHQKPRLARFIESLAGVQPLGPLPSVSQTGIDQCLGFTFLIRFGSPRLRRFTSGSLPQRCRGGKHQPAQGQTNGDYPDPVLATAGPGRVAEEAVPRGGGRTVTPETPEIRNTVHQISPPSAAGRQGGQHAPRSYTHRGTRGKPNQRQRMGPAPCAPARRLRPRT